MLQKFELEDEVSIFDLKKMGWRGKVQQSAKIVQLGAGQEDPLQRAAVEALRANDQRIFKGI